MAINAHNKNNKVMLSEREKQGISDLLMQLDLEDLLTLTDTVTNRVVSAETRQGTSVVVVIITIIEILFTSSRFVYLLISSLCREY